MAWTESEYQMVLELRARRPPATYGEIAARLGGGRTGEAVRQKLISERVAAASGSSRSRSAWMDRRLGGRPLGDKAFVRRLIAGGGHSRFTEIVRNDGTRAAYHALVMPLAGPDGRARPCGTGTCQCIGRKRCGAAA